ncbi:MULTISPECIES: GNAT family N-acetyltransferase [Streptomyces]|uniref:N-acetyltransferase n=2 Tax=Streptomyces TaxID=1883 RepID=A0A401VWQ3_STREY|nr:GNAT family N-acetyltransferase [Streptomyces paromomycinus]GCD41488.1 N-acetyltransferase [Streptomyces paromomycinus]
MNAPAPVTVTDDRAANRYEARLGGEVAGVAAYLRAEGLIALVHTEVDPVYEGNGVGSALTRHALDAARADGLRVLAVCPFVAGWMARHPEYGDLAYENRSTVTD